MTVNHEWYVVRIGKGFKFCDIVLLKGDKNKQDGHSHICDGVEETAEKTCSY